MKNILLKLFILLWVKIIHAVCCVIHIFGVNKIII